MSDSMTNHDYKDNIFVASTYMRVAVGPEYNFWQGYLLGLNLYYNGEDYSTGIWYRNDCCGDDLESQGYSAGLAGKTVQEALAEGKKGKHGAGLNGNYHREFEVGHLEKMGVIYQGVGKWTLPKGAKIVLGVSDQHPYYHVCDGQNWTLHLADGSTWIVWSDDIPGISGPPWDND